MSCNNHGCTECNPCDKCKQSCDPCATNCYQDCGCTTSVTWECITNPGVHETLGVVDTMTGTEVLAAIATTIDNIVAGVPIVGDDKYARISSTDTTSDYLNTKLLVATPLTKVVISAGADERIRFGLSFPALISADFGNQIQIGTDGKLRVLTTSTPADIKVVGGSGVTVTGTGPAADPYIVSINPSISIVRPCFDNIWRAVTLVPTGNANVVYNGGTPQYRYRYDGTVEFRGSASYTVAFGAYTTANRKFVIPMGNIPTTCLTAGEQTGAADLKGISYIDGPGVGDQITQQYGYVIRKNAQNYLLEFSSSYIAATSKSIVVNFEGAVFHPTI